MSAGATATGVPHIMTEPASPHSSSSASRRSSIDADVTSLADAQFAVPAEPAPAFDERLAQAEMHSIYLQDGTYGFTIKGVVNGEGQAAILIDVVTKQAFYQGLRPDQQIVGVDDFSLTGLQDLPMLQQRLSHPTRRTLRLHLADATQQFSSSPRSSCSSSRSSTPSSGLRPPSARSRSSSVTTVDSARSSLSNSEQASIISRVFSQELRSKELDNELLGDTRSNFRIHRSRTSDSPYVLCVRIGNEIHEVPLQCNSRNRWFITPIELFPSLGHFIDFYEINDISQRIGVPSVLLERVSMPSSLGQRTSTI